MKKKQQKRYRWRVMDEYDNVVAIFHYYNTAKNDLARLKKLHLVRELRIEEINGEVIAGTVVT